MSSSSDVEKAQGLDPVVSVTREDLKNKELMSTLSTTQTGKKINITGDVDEAMELAAELNDEEYDPVADKKLLRKIDLFIMPFICIVYCCQFADKVSNSYSAIMGLRTAYHMHGDMYSWCGTAFYFGYLIFVFPATYLLQRLPLGKTTAAFITIWGVILCLHATPSTYGGFITLRVVLGFFESAITPAMMIFTSQWYRKEEQFIRTAFWLSCNGFGTIMGGGIAYGLSAHTDYAIPAWKLVFVVDGVITIALGIAFFFHIPDSPSKAWFLTEQEKKMMILRVKTNQQGYGNHHFKKYQFVEAVKDIQTWLFFFNALAANIPNGSLSNFGTILLHEDMGFSSRRALIMNMPHGALEFTLCSGLALFNKKFSRIGISIFAMVIAFVTACMLAFGKTQGVELTGYYIVVVFVVPMICALSCFSTNTAGHTKKVSANAIYLVAYCAGNIIGPQTFVDSEAPEYHSGKITIVVCFLICIFILSAIYYVYWKRNRTRDRMKEEGVIAPELSQFENIEFADMTDKENPFFRYTL